MELKSSVFGAGDVTGDGSKEEGFDRFFIFLILQTSPEMWFLELQEGQRWQRRALGATERHRNGVSLSPVINLVILLFCLLLVHGHASCPS